MRSRFGRRKYFFLIYNKTLESRWMYFYYVKKGRGWPTLGKPRGRRIIQTRPKNSGGGPRIESATKLVSLAAEILADNTKPKN